MCVTALKLAQEPRPKGYPLGALASDVNDDLHFDSAMLDFFFFLNKVFSSILPNVAF